MEVVFKKTHQMENVVVNSPRAIEINIKKLLQIFNKSQQTFNFEKIPGKRIREPRAIRADKRACLIEFFLGLILILEVNG